MTQTTTALTTGALNEIEIADDGKLMMRKLEHVFAFSKYLVERGVAPKNSTEGVCTVAILAGNRRGFDPLFSIQNISVVNGRPTMWGDLVGAQVKASGLLEDEFEEWIEEKDKGKVTNLRCIFHVRRRGIKHEYKSEFSWTEAQRAELATKDNYKHYPRRMIKNRARMNAYRDAFPDVLMGIECREIVEEDIKLAQGKVSPAPYDQPQTDAPSAEPQPEQPAAAPVTAGTLLQLPDAEPEATDAAAAPEFQQPELLKA